MPNVAREGDEIRFVPIDEAFEVVTRALVGLLTVAIPVAVKVNVRGLKDLHRAGVFDLTRGDVVLGDGLVGSGLADGFGRAEVCRRQVCLRMLAPR